MLVLNYISQVKRGFLLVLLGVLIIKVIEDPLRDFLLLSFGGTEPLISLIFNGCLHASVNKIHLVINKGPRRGQLLISHVRECAAGHLRFLNQMFFGQVVSDEVQVISNTLIIFNRLARFKIKFVERDHLKVVDL